jgi:hypothetical protein
LHIHYTPLEYDSLSVFTGVKENYILENIHINKEFFVREDPLYNDLAIVDSLYSFVRYDFLSI